MFAFDVENHDGALSRQQSGNDNADALARTGWRFDKDMLTPAKSQEAPAFASNDNSQGRAETMPLEFTLIGNTSGPVEWCAARSTGIDQPGKPRDAAHRTARPRLPDLGNAPIQPDKIRHLERRIGQDRGRKKK